MVRGEDAEAGADGRCWFFPGAGTGSEEALGQLHDEVARLEPMGGAGFSLVLGLGSTMGWVSFFPCVG